MMKRIALFLLFALPICAQVSNPSIVLVSAAPSGSCTANLPDEQVVTLGTLYSCQSGTWTQISGGGGGGSTAFSAITGGTNTSAAMLVGTGASIGVTGSGTINATTLGGNAIGTTGATIPLNNAANTFSGIDIFSANTFMNAILFPFGATTSNATVEMFTNEMLVGNSYQQRYSNTTNVSGTVDLVTSRVGTSTLGIGTGTSGGNLVNGTLELGNVETTALTQQAASNTGGTCTMTTTSCTITIAHTYTTPVCIATEQGTGAIAGSCGVSGTTVTITAASSNTGTWGALVFGNPN
jgi:hypothetical protein